MIRTPHELKCSLKVLEDLEDLIKMEAAASRAQGTSEDLIAMSVAGYNNLKSDVEFEIQEYRDLVAGKRPPPCNLLQNPGALISWRIYKGVSIGELAQRMGVTERGIQTWERQEYATPSITVTVQDKVCAALGITRDDIEKPGPSKRSG